MGNIPAPHLTMISALNELEAQVINDFTGAYGDNATELDAAVTRVLDGLVDLLGGAAVDVLVTPYVIP